MPDHRARPKLEASLSPVRSSGYEDYNFKVVVEPDEDFDGNPSGFHAYCLALEQQGASTWGATEAEAHIDSLIRMVVQSMIEHGERLPEEPSDQVEVTVDPRVAVTA